LRKSLRRSKILLPRILSSKAFWATICTRAQQLLRWATVPEQSGPKIREGAAVPLSVGGAASPSNTKSPGLRSTSILSGICIHRAVSPQLTWAKNWGAGCAPFGGELGPHLTQCGLGRGLPPCQVSSWSIQPFGHNTPTPQTGQTDKTTV